MEIDVNIVFPMDFSRWACYFPSMFTSMCSYISTFDKFSTFDSSQFDPNSPPRFPFDKNHCKFRLSAFTFHDYKVLDLIPRRLRRRRRRCRRRRRRRRRHHHHHHRHRHHHDDDDQGVVSDEQQRGTGLAAEPSQDQKLQHQCSLLA